MVIYNIVVVAGMGAVTPIGNSVADMWESMINLRHGIAAMNRFKGAVARE